MDFFTHIICCSVNYVKSTQTSHCRVLRNDILYAFHTSEIVQTSVLALTNWQLALEMLAKVKFSLKCEISKWTWMLDSVQLCSYFSMYCYFASSNTLLRWIVQNRPQCGMTQDELLLKRPLSKISKLKCHRSPTWVRDLHFLFWKSYLTFVLTQIPRLMMDGIDLIAWLQTAPSGNSDIK